MDETVYSVGQQHRIIFQVATTQDLFTIWGFVDKYNDGHEIDRERVKVCLQDMVYLKGVYLIKHEDKAIGGISGFKIDSMLTTDRLFMVMFLYIDSEFRYLAKKVIKEFELCLLPENVTMVTFGFMKGKDSVKQLRFMKMLGYEELDTHVMKRI